MIKIINIDGIMWNRDQIAIDIMQAIYQGQDPVKIDMNGEGPCLEHIGLYNLLDRICVQTGWPKHKIEIQTANFLESHDQYRIRRVHQNYELEGTQRLFAHDPETTKIFDSDFKHFGHFIGHSNRHRLQMASRLFAYHRDRTLQTYHTQVTEAYHRAHLGLEDWLFHGASYDELDQAVDLLKNSPMTLDLPPCQDQIPIPTTIGGLISYYPRFFVEVVNLPYFSGRVFYVDEKIWRPIIMRTPFIVQGCQDFIRNFRRLGFETFNEFWDEGYCEDPSDCHNPAIINIIDNLSCRTIPDLQDMYQRMSPILEHNRRILEKLTPQDFNRSFQLPAENK
jgi:hypothetical protein